MLELKSPLGVTGALGVHAVITVEEAQGNDEVVVMAGGSPLILRQRLQTVPSFAITAAALVEGVAIVQHGAQEDVVKTIRPAAKIMEVVQKHAECSRAILDAVAEMPDIKYLWILDLVSISTNARLVGVIITVITALDHLPVHVGVDILCLRME